MTGNQQGESPNSPEKARRFRVARKVKPQPPPVLSREEQEMRDLAAMGDDADRGTPEQDASLRAGCSSMIRVVGLFFLVMIGSIIATMFLRK